jgi:ribosomal protein L24
MCIVDIAIDVPMGAMSFLNANLLYSSHYFAFQDSIPTDLNEREGFVAFTWSFIRGALTLCKIKSRSLEVSVHGVKERKNQGKGRTDTQESATKADGVGICKEGQIYVAEAALLQNAKFDKEHDDSWKVKRAMRDSWISQVKAICNTALPPSGMRVFGSSSFNAETKFYAMDFAGAFRLYQINKMTVPLEKESFAPLMRICLTRCLEFGLYLLWEIERRKDATTATYLESEDLAAAAKAILRTSMTPTKDAKRKDTKQ